MWRGGGGVGWGFLSVAGIFHSLRGPGAAKKLSKIWTARVSAVAYTELFSICIPLWQHAGL